MADHTDVQVQLHDLEVEEERIIRELREIEEKTRTGNTAAGATASAPPQGEAHIDDPDATLASLLAECEKEVRDAKGYISEHGPPMRIVRLRKGEQGPKTATYLSRPHNTGVDFTIPVTIKSYSQAIKNPIFLNDIRDKIRSRAYTHPDEYIADMRLLYRNTNTFNKGPDLEWVVQHARLLLEAAEEAVKSRSKSFAAIERALRQSSSTKQRPPASASKRKRTSEPPQSERPSGPGVGATIEIWWGTPYRRWFPAVIVDRSGSSKAFVRYKSDDSTSWVSLHGSSACNWRLPVAKPPTPAVPPSRPSSRRTDPPPGKKRRAAPTSPRSSAGAPVVIDTVNGDTDALRSAVTSQLGDAVTSIKEQLREGLERVELMVHRSDGLQRVLVAVQDTQNTIQASLGKLSKSVEQIKSSVRSVQRDVAELRESMSSGGRVPQRPRRETMEYNRNANENSRRYDHRKERDGHLDTRKDRGGVRDYDRDSRRTDFKKGSMDHRNRSSTRPERRRSKDSRSGPLERKSDARYLEKTRRGEDPMDVDNDTPEPKDHARNGDFVMGTESPKDKVDIRTGRYEDDGSDLDRKSVENRVEAERNHNDNGEGKGVDIEKDIEKQRDEVGKTVTSPKRVRDSRDDDSLDIVEVKDSPDPVSVEKRKGRGNSDHEKSGTDDEREVTDKSKIVRGERSDERNYKSSRRADKGDDSVSDSDSNTSSDSEDNEDEHEDRRDDNNDFKKGNGGRDAVETIGGSGSKVTSPKRHPDKVAEPDKKFTKKDDGDNVDGGRLSDHERDRERDRDLDRHRVRARARNPERDPESDHESSRHSGHESNRESDRSGKGDVAEVRKRGSDSEGELDRDRDREREVGRRSDRKGDGWDGSEHDNEEGRIQKKNTSRNDHDSDHSEDHRNSREKKSDGKDISKGGGKDTGNREDRDDSSDDSEDHDASSSDSEEEDQKEESSKADAEYERDFKRTPGAGRPKVSRFAQAPEEDEANRDENGTKKTTSTNTALNGADGSNPGTPINDSNEEKATNGSEAKSNGASN